MLNSNRDVPDVTINGSIISTSLNFSDVMLILVFNSIRKKNCLQLALNRILKKLLMLTYPFFHHHKIKINMYSKCTEN